MKLKINIYSLAAALILTASTSTLAQNCNDYFPLKEGVTHTIKSYDAKDKLESINKQTVKSASVSGGKTTAIISSQVLDKKGKETGSGEFTVTCENGNIEIDMKNLLNSVAQLQSFQGMELSVDAQSLDIPANPTVGQKLKDGKVTASISNMGINLFKMTMVISDRKVEELTKITTPAGTFDCVKISHISRAQIGPKLVESKVISYYGKGVGIVRSETYKLKNNTLVSYQQLEAID